MRAQQSKATPTSRAKQPCRTPRPAGSVVDTRPPRRGERRALALPPRSLLVLAGEARHAWHHYIPHRKSDPAPGGGRAPRAPRRVSLTFRQAQPSLQGLGTSDKDLHRKPLSLHLLKSSRAWLHAAVPGTMPSRPSTAQVM